MVPLWASALKRLRRKTSFPTDATNDLLFVKGALCAILVTPLGKLGSISPLYTGESAVSDI